MRVQVAIGRCPVCGGRAQSAEENGLDSFWCGRGHEPTRYIPEDAYYMDEADTWDDSKGRQV
jgi:hypothetical protein